MTYSGTAALSAAAKGLRRIGRDHLLAPSFNCGHEIEPFLREKFQLRVYRVDKHGIIDLDDFESNLQGSRQVALVTHYFGFAGNVKTVHELCREQDVCLLEDCAHALLGRVGDRYLGSWGDLSIFSFRKTLPIPDGGCLVLNNSSIPGVPPSAKPRSLAVFKRTAKLLIEHLFLGADGQSQFGFEVLRKLKGALLLGHTALRIAAGRNSLHLYSVDDESFDFDSRVLDWSISKRSLLILERFDTRDIKSRRRRNYLYIQEALGNLKRLRPLFDNLPAGICPLEFPLVAPEDHPRAREVMRQYPYIALWWPHFHPSVKWEHFPESRLLKNNCYVIAIHQDMKKKHLDFLIDCALRADKDLL